MNIPDYLHSELLADRHNHLVFEKTYSVIDSIAKRITDMEIAAFNITDEDTKYDLLKINATWVSNELINLVNYTIKNFNKNHKP